jgi:hypothetical protein
MRKQDRQARWPYQEFDKYLNDLMVAAGIPLSKQGTPNTVVFEEWTGIDPARVSRWRKGLNQPTTDSLRQVAEGLADRIGMDPTRLLITLEVKAGRRSEAEANVSGVSDVAMPLPEPDIELIIERIEKRLSQDPPAAERRKLERRLVQARRVRDAKRLADELMEEFNQELREA